MTKPSLTSFFLAALVSLASSGAALAGNPYANSGRMAGPAVRVTPANVGQVTALQRQAACLERRLSTYNQCAITPTSNPAVHAERVAENERLASEVASYNAAVRSVAAQSPMRLHTPMSNTEIAAMLRRR